MSKKGSVNYQIHQLLEQLNCIGQSRHQAKIEAQAIGYSKNGSLKTVGIHSEATFRAYRDTGKAFAKHLKKIGIRNISHVRAHHIVDFLRQEYERGLTPASIDRHLAGLNKLFGLNITKKQAKLPVTSYKNITRGRGEQKGTFDPEKNMDQMNVSRFLGNRRESIYPTKGYRKSGSHQLIPSSIWQRPDGQIVAGLIEKNGKYRVAPVLQEHQESFREIIERRSGKKIPVREDIPTKQAFDDHYQNALAKGETYLFDNYSSHINNHAFRREYAQAMYPQILSTKGPGKKKYRGYDQDALAIVSKCLGHNRLNIIVENYMR